MRSRQLVCVAALVAVCAIGLGVVAHEGALPISEPDRATLHGVRAGILAEIERMRDVAPSRRPEEDGSWRAHLEVVDGELARGHIDAAVRAWHDAYGEALVSRNWESMIVVGDAFLRIGEAAGTPHGARMKAREAYVSGLIRARRSRSVEGLVRSAQAFDGLGDAAVSEQCLVIAGWLASADAHAQEMVRKAWARRAAFHALAEF